MTLARKDVRCDDAQSLLWISANPYRPGTVAPLKTAGAPAAGRVTAAVAAAAFTGKCQQIIGIDVLVSLHCRRVDPRATALAAAAGPATAAATATQAAAAAASRAPPGGGAPLRLTPPTTGSLTPGWKPYFWIEQTDLITSLWMCSRRWGTAAADAGHDPTMPGEACQVNHRFEQV